VSRRRKPGCQASHRARLESNHPSKRRSAEATRVSRRASRRAHLESKRYMQAVGHAAGHSSNHPPKRRERTVGQDAGSVSICTIRQSDTRASRLASCRARLEACAAVGAAAHTAPSTERSVEQAVAAEPRTIRRSSCSQRAPQISNRTP